MGTQSTMIRIQILDNLFHMLIQVILGSHTLIMGTIMMEKDMTEAKRHFNPVVA